MNEPDIIEYVPGLYGTSLNLDLSSMKKSCLFMESAVKKKFNYQEEKKQRYIGTTDLYEQYNLLLHPFPEFHELYFNIQRLFHEVLTHYSGKTNYAYYMQSWLNVFRKGEFIDWHGHWTPDKNAWHGFFCVDVEPNSKTSYFWPNKPDMKMIDIESKNNLLVIGTSDGDKHKSSQWENDFPRITIAFDIVPRNFLNMVEEEEKIISLLDHPRGLDGMCNSPGCFNHWIPI